MKSKEDLLKNLNKSQEELEEAKEKMDEVKELEQPEPPSEKKMSPIMLEQVKKSHTDINLDSIKKFKNSKEDDIPIRKMTSQLLNFGSNTSPPRSHDHFSLDSHKNLVNEIYSKIFSKIKKETPKISKVSRWFKEESKKIESGCFID